MRRSVSSPACSTGALLHCPDSRKPPLTTAVVLAPPEDVGLCYAGTWNGGRTTTERRAWYSAEFIMVPLKRMAEGETSRESSIDLYTLLRVEQITSRSLLCRTGNPALCSVAPWRGFKCPICSKSVASDEMEMHFIMCLSKPRLSYNDDVLTKDAGECVICLEELLQGDTIARLPCLCIYHKSCIDSWFEVNRSCPEHPAD
ncbi:E3 ubiquitin-protein ligase ZNRF1 isoform X2 [Ovis aries]|uniref:E3 ubiquitin-protein ligase ZNRF1 isoform X2 n=1 Tax=Ovis aries TaxID=9940 RepID=UPI001C2ECB7A|nr:E3 ubiquitin-protein ligase ZNRF1 isoform X2 [Ovis aries]